MFKVFYTIRNYNYEVFKSEIMFCNSKDEMDKLIIKLQNEFNLKDKILVISCYEIIDGKEKYIETIKKIL
jgi:cellulose synthase/poly-beta-1,6-N-acetylglucosamine synthase-like glycosyltransferase